MKSAQTEEAEKRHLEHLNAALRLREEEVGTLKRDIDRLQRLRHEDRGLRSQLMEDIVSLRAQLAEMNQILDARVRTAMAPAAEMPPPPPVA